MSVAARQAPGIGTKAADSTTAFAEKEKLEHFNGNNVEFTPGVFDFQ
jgi:hypothetical protein